MPPPVKSVMVIDPASIPVIVRGAGQFSVAKFGSVIEGSGIEVTA